MPAVAAKAARQRRASRRTARGYADPGPPACAILGAVMESYAEYKQALAGARLPAAYVDLERFDANVAAVTARARGKRVRVASKSIRCAALLRRVLESDPAYRGVLCYSPWEAVF